LTDNLHRKWVPAKPEDRSRLPGPHSSIRHSLAYWSVGQTDKEYAVLVRSTGRAVAAKSAIPGPYWRRHQRLETAEKWPPTRLSSGSNALQSVQQRPPGNPKPEVHLCRRHLRGHTSTHFAELECSLTADMARMAQFCHCWCLKPDVTKTVSSV